MARGPPAAGESGTVVQNVEPGVGRRGPPVRISCVNSGLGGPNIGWPFQLTGATKMVDWTRRRTLFAVAAPPRRAPAIERPLRLAVPSETRPRRFPPARSHSTCRPPTGHRVRTSRPLPGKAFAGTGRGGAPAFEGPRRPCSFLRLLPKQNVPAVPRPIERHPVVSRNEQRFVSSRAVDRLQVQVADAVRAPDEYELPAVGRPHALVVVHPVERGSGLLPVVRSRSTGPRFRCADRGARPPFSSRRVRAAWSDSRPDYQRDRRHSRPVHPQRLSRRQHAAHPIVQRAVVRHVIRRASFRRNKGDRIDQRNRIA